MTAVASETTFSRSKQNRRITAEALAILLILGTAVPAAHSATPSSATDVDEAALAQRIDQAIGQRLQAERIKPSPLADDAEFLRRAYLDITGIIPSADKAAAFLDSKDPTKRAKLIDELLASPRFGQHMADIWKGYLLPRTSDNRQLQTEPLTRWLAESFNGDKPWDQLVTELITASGKQDEHGAVTFFLANPTADKVTDAVSRLFLGVQLQCAQCHNHPFTKWKQTEYWGMAAFFTKVKTDRVKQAAKQGDAAAVSEDAKGGPAKLPMSAKVVPAKFLQGEEPKLDRAAPYRPVLAKWMTSPENPFFARAMANRLWAQFFGRGIVDPVDDMHDGNPPSHPELLQELAEQFAAHHFDVKFLIRASCNSRTYQRTSKPNDKDDSGANLFAHMAIKVNSPEQLYDSLLVVLGAPGEAAKGRKAPNQKAPNQGKKTPGADPRAVFVNFFLSEDGADPTQYQAGIPQALRLMNSPQLSSGALILEQALKSAQPPAQIVERLYLATLSRRPTSSESQRLTNFVHSHGTDARKAYRDILWAVLNSSEFALNH
jgi:Protein of unknown function (DUF1549)/Protein of unknown function (DUF1553)